MAALVEVGSVKTSVNMPFRLHYAGRIGARAVVHSYSYYFMLIFKGPHSYTCLGT